MDDLALFCCQNPDCPDYGLRAKGNLRICFRYGPGKQRRMLACRTCQQRFSERKGTACLAAGWNTTKLSASHKVRENNRVVKVETRLVFGTLLNLTAALVWSVLAIVNTVFIERSNGTDRLRNSRKVRKSYRFSKDWGVHEAMTYFTLYSSNFCNSVRTLQVEIAPKQFQQRSPAMAAALADHVWSLEEWLLFPSNGRYKIPPFSKNLFGNRMGTPPDNSITQPVADCPFC